MDVSIVSIADLRNLHEEVKQELKRREHQEIVNAREQYRQSPKASVDWKRHPNYDWNSHCAISKPRRRHAAMDRS